MTGIDWKLSRDAFGHLLFTNAQGETSDGVTVVRAFPLTAPDAGVAVVTSNGRELAWIDRPAALPEPLRSLIAEELAGREFMPQIQRIYKVSSYATPSTWQVETDRGDTAFILRGEEDIRRVGQRSLLIADKYGIQFLIQDLMALDVHSRKILDRFL